LVVAVGIWVLWRTGPGKVSFLDLFESTARHWPSAPLAADGQYILRQPLGQILYRLLPVHGVTVFLGLHALCLLGSGLLLATWLCRRLGHRSGLVAGMVVALAPISAVLLVSVGMYDAFSVLVWVGVLMSLDRRVGWQLAAGVLAGVQDFEQMAVGLVLIVLLPGLARAAGYAPGWRTCSVGPWPASSHWRYTCMPWAPGRAHGCPTWPGAARLPQTWLLVLAPPVVLVDYTTVQMGIKPGTWGIGIF